MTSHWKFSLGTTITSESDKKSGARLADSTRCAQGPGRQRLCGGQVGSGGKAIFSLQVLHETEKSRLISYFPGGGSGDSCSAGTMMVICPAA